MSRTDIVGRKKEQMLLDSYMSSNKAEFIAVYGRRRVGKTFLIKQMYENEFDFYITGIYGGSKKEQLANFNRRINKYSGSYYPVVENWFDAFAQLQHYIETIEDKSRIIVFIDELPWLDTPKSKFIRALELFWNEWAGNKKNMKFIVCGSATTWMTNKLLGDKGGLHNRVTRPIKLSPFTLGETEEYLQCNGFQIDKLQTLEAYMCLGGTPYYLSMLSPAFSVTQNIDDLFFSETAPLRDEYNFLFRSLFNNAAVYQKIIELLSKKLKGLTKQEIINELHLQDNGNLTEALENLCRCDFVRKYNAFGKKTRGMMYQLIDLYCLFYLRFVKDNNSQDTKFWSNAAQSGAVKAWSGYAFEQVCLQHIEQIKQKLKITNISSDVCSWQNAEAQIDLVIDRKDRVINLCEMKFSDEPFSITKSYLEKLIARRELFRNSTGVTKSLHITMVSPFGLKQNSQSKEIQSVVNLQDLFL